MDRVTDLQPPLAGSRPHAAEAARRAADGAGVHIREVADLDGLDAVYRLFDRIWRPDPANPPVTTELMRALTKAGNYVGGAYAGAELVGACVGFFGTPADEVLHSHIAGVAPAMAGRSVGLALKLHQRAWALQRGISVIEWTFDPLVARNAWFNLVKLGATAVEYLPNFYGGMRDGINGDDETDRLLVHWRLDTPAVAAACAGTLRPCDARAELAGGAVVALGRSGPATPVPGSSRGRRLLVAVPNDVEKLRAADPGRAKEWRVAVREALVAPLAEGARITGFDKSGWYLVTRDTVREDGR
ncbi:GNAT family N-acetyltransferase [Amycolatopsis acidiphila]|uniref:GNAT family N-acetyltransferase n=1 Tax=Amycolatopsis acidiphila TaxID=715473 RepID=A0A558A9K4_9PSEU|nr:GNAT family N-acetyltransferase [Amycolatopsis acidiphila]TVT20939.1 GNAT family N-acetyltransferase [Amycolatopsis acidiphila]UIJ63874.1 GNAT family N-acetyltransferase [Amycolatopsis acidiphila]